MKHHVYIYIYLYMNIQIHICKYIYVYIYVYTYIIVNKIAYALRKYGSFPQTIFFAANNSFALENMTFQES